MSSVETERVYALTRVRAGDYLLPSNDAKTLWRISSYEEDGTAEVSADGKTWRPLRGTFWQIHRYETPLPLPDNADDFLEWEHWQSYDCGYETRAEAIEGALKRG